MGAPTGTSKCHNGWKIIKDPSTCRETIQKYYLTLKKYSDWLKDAALVEDSIPFGCSMFVDGNNLNEIIFNRVHLKDNVSPIGFTSICYKDCAKDDCTNDDKNNWNSDNLVDVKAGKE